MREIRERADIPESAVYYSRDHEYRGARTIFWFTLYDQDFNEIERVNVIYTNAIAHLREIAKNPDKFTEAAYTLTPAENGYYFVAKNENTAAALTAFCESVRPKDWRR